MTAKLLAVFLFGVLLGGAIVDMIGQSTAIWTHDNQSSCR